MNSPTFKCRASAGGALMTNPRSKSESLSETTKTYAQNWLKEQIYGMKYEIDSKYMKKGVLLEDEAIDSAIQWLDLPFTLKNESHFEDDFFTGTPDLILEDEVLDIKNSWDAFSFPLFDTEIPTKGYEYQLQIYMHLTGKRKARLVYVLLNTPEHLTYEPQHNYDNVDKAHRIKTFCVNYDPQIIEALQERVKEVRNYLETIKP
jgi:hypothetical protein